MTCQKSYQTVNKIIHSSTPQMIIINQHIHHSSKKQTKTSFVSASQWSSICFLMLKNLNIQNIIFMLHLPTSARIFYPGNFNYVKEWCEKDLKNHHTSLHSTSKWRNTSDVTVSKECVLVTRIFPYWLFPSSAGK